MATVVRPLKTYGTRSYATEVAAAPSNYDPILANEVDADLDTIYAAVNAGADKGGGWVRTAGRIDQGDMADCVFVGDGTGQPTSNALTVRRSTGIGSIHLASGDSSAAMYWRSNQAQTDGRGYWDVLAGTGTATGGSFEWYHQKWPGSFIAKIDGDKGGFMFNEKGLGGSRAAFKWMDDAARAVGPNSTAQADIVNGRSVPLQQYRSYRVLAGGGFNRAVGVVYLFLYVGGIQVMGWSNNTSTGACDWMIDSTNYMQGGGSYVRQMGLLHFANNVGWGTPTTYVVTTQIARSEGTINPALGIALIAYFDTAHASNYLTSHIGFIECA